MKHWASAEARTRCSEFTRNHPRASDRIGSRFGSLGAGIGIQCFLHAKNMYQKGATPHPSMCWFGVSLTESKCKRKGRVWRGKEPYLEKEG